MGDVKFSESPWEAVAGEPLNVELISRLVHKATGAVREVRRLEVPGGFVYHFSAFADKQRTESCTFVPVTEWTKVKK